MCLLLWLCGAAGAGPDVWTSPATTPNGAVVFQTAAATGPEPYETGRKAALELQAALGGAAPRAVLLMDSFEDLEPKQTMLKGVASVFPPDLLFGGASYGGFTQRGAVDYDSVVLLGLAGDGVGLAAALAENMGAAGLSSEENQEQLTAALNRAGEQLARQLSGIERGTLLLLIADAHSPKNQLLLDGVQTVAGRQLPVTGGSVNKNAGQSWVYFRGAAYTDSAVGLLLTGPFQVSQAGRQAKSNEKVIETAREGAAAALQGLAAQPFGILTFSCAGRKGQLNRLEEELEAIQASVGQDLPLFGTYCAGEFGPADTAESHGDPTPCGRGWHAMFTVLGR
jgi:hypothetical protein